MFFIENILFFFSFWQTSTGEKWKNRRKLITPSFHFRILDEFFKVFVEQTGVLLSILDNVKDKDYFDIYPYLTRYTLDIICGKKELNISDSL